MTDHEALVAELWYAEAPDLADPLLLEGLRAVVARRPRRRTVRWWCRTTAPSSPRRCTGRTAATATPRAGSSRPCCPGSPSGEGASSCPTPARPGTGREADEALAGARASVLVTEMFAAAYGARDRAAALVATVAALAAATRPVAISWPTSQRVTDPAESAIDGLGGLLNVRLFTVAEEEDERVMDTRGLAPFGLPDVQIHFRDLEPGRAGGAALRDGQLPARGGRRHRRRRHHPRTRRGRALALPARGRARGARPPGHRHRPGRPVRSGAPGPLSAAVSPRPVVPAQSSPLSRPRC